MVLNGLYNCHQPGFGFHYGWDGAYSGKTMWVPISSGVSCRVLGAWGVVWLLPAALGLGSLPHWVLFIFKYGIQVGHGFKYGFRFFIGYDSPLSLDLGPRFIDLVLFFCSFLRKKFKSS